ncbi:uncharacterized protein KY384_003329 [Bacidia gigantensis]|uniref:uncharacterized protein n=1 Tax=Bacidia gigantensis TaxID=2732470 RepID=UPI001D03E972|nr:uncharacterized protein KY384_003329 [Bacidia gigantensis]KAG8531697.1 hypothetical protein KY384_003329 [Bacidia gigantensis]
MCVFAGTRTGQLEYMDIMTINTSYIGQLSTGGKLAARAADSTQPAKAAVTSAAAKGKDAAKNQANKAVKEAAKDLGIKEWYSYHLMTHCEGDYTPSPVMDATHHPKKKPTKCSSAKAFSGIDPAADIQKELKGNKKLSDLGWTKTISDLVKGTKALFVVIFLAYLLGLIVNVLAMITTGLTIMAEPSWKFLRIKFYLNAVTTGLFLFATLSHTFFIYRVRDIINAGGNLINVYATVGKTFITLSWTMTLLCLTSLALAWWEQRRWLKAARGYGEV